MSVALPVPIPVVVPGVVLDTPPGEVTPGGDTPPPVFIVREMAPHGGGLPNDTKMTVNDDQDIRRSLARATGRGDATTDRGG